MANTTQILVRNTVGDLTNHGDIHKIQRLTFSCLLTLKLVKLQSGASNRAKIGGAYFSDVTGSIQDPIAVPGPCEVTQF